ncbi:MAG: nucleoside hydrolase-like domain-containing protein [Runella zeae]
MRLFVYVFLLFSIKHLYAQPSEKLRVLILTDIENEPDDTQSMVRFLTYSNQWDIEGIVATTSIHQRDRTAPESIRKIVNAYDKVRSNLLLHEKGFPETAFLLGIIKSGYPKCGMEAVGYGKDPEGTQCINKHPHKHDPRPLWIPVWGGANCLAQALWKVKMTRTPDEVAKFVAKLRVYTISDQDDSGPWIRKNFPQLFYIASPGFHANGAYHYATWSGISGDKFHGRFSGANFGIVDNPWLEQHIRKNHGPLGEEYPAVKFLMEGDTPTFLYLIPNGLGDSEHPDYGSWGGRYEFYTPRTQKWFYESETRPLWADAVDEVMGMDSSYQTSNKATIWRWREAFQHDFAARMDWCVKSYKEANHPPVAKLSHAHLLKVKSGEKVQLSAKGSTDPDGNILKYDWIYYAEPGTYGNKNGIQINDKTKAEAWFVAPKVTQPETIHIVLAVSDNGTPSLTRYQRVIATVFP